MGLYRAYFAQRVIAEMMGPITPDGHNTLWEYFGRRFINLTYSEADKFCQYSREFMTSLLPPEEVYLTLLPPEARALIGQVGPDTLPARRMLEELGFRNHDEVDPFDGGPLLECATEKISVVRDTRRVKFAGVCPPDKATSQGFVSVMHDDGDFRAVHTRFAEAPGGVSLLKEAAEALALSQGQELGVAPLTLSNRGASDGNRRRTPAAV